MTRRGRLPGSARVLLVLGWLAGCGTEPPPTVLDRDSRQPIERRLAPAEIQVFEIALEHGEFLVLRVDQRGIDLVLDARAGGEPRVIDNWSGADGAGGAERVVWVAETAQHCRVAVSASIAGRGGDFTVQIEQLRAASAEDRVWARAEAAIAAGDELYWRGPRDVDRPAALRQAISAYEQARAGFEALGDLKRRADVWFRLAEARRALGELPAAIDLYGRALVLYEAVGDQRQLALTHHHRGFTRYTADEVEAALDDFQRALPLYRKTGDRLGEAQTLNEIGAAQRFLGEGRAALVAYDAALEIWRELGDLDQEARTLHNRGRLYLELGKSEQGLADLETALALRRELGRPNEVISTLNFLGFAHAHRGELDKALACFGEALALADTRGERAAAISRAGSGEVQRKLGRLDEALAALEPARASFRALGDRAWEAATTAAIGRLQIARGEAAAGLASLEQARGLFSAIRDRAGVAEALLGMAVAERRLGRLDAARRSIEAALIEVEDLRARAAAGDELRAYFLATKQSYYDVYVDLLMALDEQEPAAGWAAKALAAAERGRARSLLESLGENRPSAVDPELEARRRALEREINRCELRLMHLPAAGESEEAAQLEREQTERVRRYERVREEIRAADPQPASAPAALGPAEIQHRLLDPETLLLVYRLGEERSFLWAVSDTALASFELPARAELETKVTSTYGLLVESRRRSRRRVELLLDQLSRDLLGPVAALLEGKQRLAIVADGALHLLPFAALPAPGTEREPLVARHEIALIPSAGALALLRERSAARKPAPGLVAVVADPVFGDAYPRLEHAGEEAKAILALVPPAQSFAAQGFAASRDVIASGELGRYRIVHFATHGELDAEHPELSRLVLALVDDKGRPREDGLLYAHEIRQLDLPVELVVLSACRTALGRGVAGEGVLGLTRSLLDAGAPRVVVSLWSVADQPTAELMERFYRAMLVDGLAPPAALAAAQQQVRRDPRWRDPLDWAGFVFQGEWEDLPRAFIDRE